MYITQTETFFCFTMTLFVTLEQKCQLSQLSWYENMDYLYIQRENGWKWQMELMQIVRE